MVSIISDPGHNGTITPVTGEHTYCTLDNPSSPGRRVIDLPAVDAMLTINRQGGAGSALDILLDSGGIFVGPDFQFPTISTNGASVVTLRGIPYSGPPGGLAWLVVCSSQIIMNEEEP